MPRDEKITNEAEAMQAIVMWSSAWKNWQRDALRRLVTAGALSEADIDELLVICKSADNQFSPLLAEHVSAQGDAAQPVTLREISAVDGVNALAPKQFLKFAPDGLTAVYGDNGAGKSGYVRIIKSIGRTRGADADHILPNAFKAGAVSQTAEIAYAVGGSAKKTTWRKGGAVDDPLSEISVFDSAAATALVGKDNTAAYTPYPMRLLQQLVAACGQVRSKLEVERAALGAQTSDSLRNPKCEAGTEVAKEFPITAKTDSNRIEALAALTAEEMKRRADLQTLFAQDGRQEAQKIRAQINRLKLYQNRIVKLSDAASAKTATDLQGLAADLKTKQAAAALAAAEQSAETLLPGFGEDAWIELWKAARAYSTTAAYPERAFPARDAGAKCVLCQQELDARAGDRLERFEAFVSDRTQKEADAAKAALAEKRTAMEAARLDVEAQAGLVALLSDELDDAQRAAAATALIEAATGRLSAVLEKNADVDQPEPDVATLSLDAVIIELDKRASEFDANAESEERLLARAELNDLEAQSWLAGVKKDALDEIERQSQIAGLDAAIAATKTTALSGKISQISDALLTDRLREAFRDELKALGVGRLAVEWEPLGAKQGEARGGLRLTNASNPGKVADILSEGEHRCVALASFLAELATSGTCSTLLFDDPVSSLDHVNRALIAERLVKEAQTRQVIVFTHDLSFFVSLRDRCTRPKDTAQRTPFTPRCVQRKFEGPGYCRNDAPDKAAKLGKLASTWRAHLAATRRHYEDNPDGVQWRTTAQGVLDDIRQG